MKAKRAIDPTALDKLGEYVKTRIGHLKANEHDVETTRLDVQADLRRVWDAFDEAKKNKVAITINGAASKTEWAEKFAAVTMRYIQYILKDGNRKDQRKKQANSVRAVTIKLGETVRFEGLDGTFKVGTGEGTVKFIKGVKYNDSIHIAVTKVEIAPIEETAPVKKKDKKPIKHAKNPKTRLAWCNTALTHHDNTASQARRSNCPYCIAAMAAGIPVMNPETWRRSYQKELAEARKNLAWSEKHEKDKSDQWFATYREEIAEFERKIAAISEVKTPGAGGRSCEESRSGARSGTNKAAKANQRVVGGVP